MQKRKNNITKIVILSIALFLIASNVAFAAPSWWPIVPCGLSQPGPTDPGIAGRDYTQPCNSCDLFVMGRNIIDFILMGLMPPVAAGLFIWGGFLILMGGPKPEYYTKGKAIFTTTFYGVLIILGSWLITNTIMMSVAKDSIEVKKADGTTETVNIVTDWSNYKCETTTVVEPPPPTPNNGGLTISPDSLPDVVVGHDYSQTLSVSGGKEPYTWSSPNADSVLPTDCGFLTNNEATVVCNSPEVDTAGPYPFTVKVEDSTAPTKLSATKEYVLRVFTTAQSLTITTSSLPDAPIGVAYNQTLSANGGIAPYSWSAQGAWPAGLQMSNAGVIIGTPTTISSTPFTPVITVTDNSTPPISFKKTMTLKVTTGTSGGNVPGQAQAQSLLSSGISFSNSGDCGAQFTAQTSIQAIANNTYPPVCSCQCANSCPAGGASGNTTVNPAILDALLALKQSVGNYTVTSFTTGSHCGGDSHYTGHAVDLVPAADRSQWPNYRAFLNAHGGYAMCEDTHTAKDVPDCNANQVTHIHWTN